MKNLIILFLLTFPLNIIGQTTIEPLFGNDDYTINNAYYKDLDNDFDPYVGTWLYTNGNTSLQIVFQKKEMVQHEIVNSTVYEDFLIGEYQYIENGEEKVNTLSNLSLNLTNFIDYNMFSMNIIDNKKAYPECTECLPLERRVFMYFNEPTRRNVIGLVGGLMLRRFSEGGSVKLKASFFLESVSMGFKDDGSETDIEGHSIPYGDYILDKIE